VELAANIVSAYVAKNSVRPADLPALIEAVHGALRQTASGPQAQEPEAPTPAVPVKKSVTPDHIISLFDGQKFKSLKRYLRISHNISPEEYRQHFGLPHDYPMVAPNYAKARSELAKQMGLGSARKGASRGRSKKAA
jgi:predicted transcriptional regulator